MWLKIHTWFISLKPIMQLLILFIINGVFWFVAWEFYLWYFNETYRSLGSRILHAAWMSFILIIPLNLKTWKQIFKKPSNAK